MQVRDPPSISNPLQTSPEVQRGGGEESVTPQKGTGVFHNLENTAGVNDKWKVNTIYWERLENLNQI